jgi:predicted enzyme related to lactoylglutathione lyase
MAAKKSTKKKSGSRKLATTIRKIRPGFISHTELASTDPGATKAWCRKVLGWKFGDPMQTPAGPYHMGTFGDNTAVGIRANNPPEIPGSVPYCEVPDIKAAYERALKAGATGVFPPDEIPGGNRWIAIVQAPGGVAIGLWGPK